MGRTGSASNRLTDIAAAARHVAKADRIMVIGCSGGGKTTLSMALSRRFGLPYISLDRDMFWLPGWKMRSKAEERALMAGFVAGDRWVIDGNDTSSFDLRLPRTDIVLWVRPRRAVCFWSVILRSLRWRGQIRPEMAAGCPEKIDLEFLRYIWTFEKKIAPRTIAGLDRHGPSVGVVEFRSRRQMREFLALLPPSRSFEPALGRQPGLPPV